MLRLILLSVMAIVSVNALNGNDVISPMDDYCYHVPDPNPLLESPSGLTRILWVICAADSAAIQPYDSLPFGRGGLCGNHRRRETYPSTYNMPSWVDVVFDSLSDRSLSRFFLDQSYGNKVVSGRVVGDTSGGIFLCDTNIWLEPNQCAGHTGGFDFFQNIMEKVDAQNNLAEFLSSPNDASIYVFFHIYGHAETRTYIDHNGQDSTVTWISAGGNGSLPAGFTSADTNALGHHIGVRGCTGWSYSEEFIATQPEGQRNPALAAYWEGISIVAHEFYRGGTWSSTCPARES